VTILGKGTSVSLKSKAIIARSNLGLLLQAIAYLQEKKQVQRIYFEGNIHSYTYADDGASLYDVLNLHNGDKHLIRDRLIRTMRDADELKEYIEKTEDMQLAMMMDIVQQYGKRLPALIKSIKDRHVSDEDRAKAEVIFSTVHRCKGMEYDEVQLADDFIPGSRLRQWKETGRLETMDLQRLTEEVNLLYVAVTRARNLLFLPQSLLPEGIPASPHILVLEPEQPKEVRKLAQGTQGGAAKPVSKEAYAANARSRHEHANAPWTAALDHELTVLYHEGSSPKEMMAYFGRSASAIRSRLIKLGLLDD
jgi:ATP-dependent exoDNAse (exonuclease V) beta subunit